MSDTFQLREVFNKEIVDLIAENIEKQYSLFDKEGFINHIYPKLTNLSFGDRSNLITEALEKYLPQKFEEVADILLNSLGPEVEIADLSGYDGFYIMPMGNYVSRNGKEYFDLSMKLLYEMTKRFTSEGPIRTFIELYPEKSLKLLHIWAKDENFHVRRLVSEGTRPRLPLSSPLRKYVTDPAPVIELLTKLNSSEELYVRRSIANNLNDISKDNPKIVTQTLQKWKRKNKSKNMDWLIKHALRTLLKQGNKEALELLGYPSDPDIAILNFTLQKSTIKIGEKIEFQFGIINQSSKSVNLMIDYIVHFMKSSGKTRPKVFKLSKKKLKKAETANFRKYHLITQLSTRKIYPGIHQLQLQINGKKFQIHEFAVKT
jgi:3-methyladenine DNA glycosylase AlkC